MADTKAVPAKASTKPADAAPAVSPIAAAVARTINPLEPTRMQEAEFGRAVFVCTAQPDTHPTDLEHQGYWASVAPSLQRWARLEVRADDGSWYAELVVLDAGRNWANVKTLHLWNLTADEMGKSSDAIAAEYAGLPYEVKYRGEHSLWSVLRKSDSAVMHEMEGTKAGADTWLRERMKADRH